MIEPLAIDPEHTVVALEDYIRKVVAERGLDGVMLGLSGGIDSTLVATLAVRALGPGRVNVIYLYDYLNSPALTGEMSSEDSPDIIALFLESAKKLEELGVVEVDHFGDFDYRKLP